MKTTDTQHAVNLPGGAESQLLQSSLLMMAQQHGENGAGGPPALSAAPTLTGLLHALRRRWLLGLALAAAATTAAVFAVFYLMPPKYNTTLEMRVVAKQAGPEDVEFSIFKASMEAMVKNPIVLSAALNDKTADGRDIKDLELVRSKGLGAVDWLRKGLKTDYLLGPEVLRITLAADNPQEAADLLNAIGKSFLHEYAEMERSKKQQRLADLRKQKEKIEEDLRKLRDNLKSILATHDIKDHDSVSVQQRQWLDKISAAETTRRIIDDEMGKAHGRKSTAEARLKNVDKQKIPDLVLYEALSKDPIIQGLDRALTDLDTQIAKLKGQLEEPARSAFIKPLKDQKVKLGQTKEEREIELMPALEKRWRESVKADLVNQIAVSVEEIQEGTQRRQSVLNEIQKYQIQLKEAGGANRPAQVVAIEEKIEGSKKSLEYSVQKINEAELEPLPARIIPIQQAAPPLDRDRTQQTKIAGAGGLGIFVLALFGVAFFEFRTRKIGEPEDVSRGLGLNVIGTIPALPTRAKNPNANDASADADWVGPLNESVDAIRTVLLHQARSEALHVVMITSANGGEGKTTLATQLAASLARGWKRTLVIDGDLRHPATHTLFDVPQEPGLAEVLRGEVESADAVRATSFSRLWVLPAGNGDAHAIQALAQDSVRTLFEQLKQQYDFIIIDAPPVLPVTDSLLLGQHVDGVLFAILTDVSRAPAVYAAQQKLAPLGLHTLGAVVLGAASEFGDKKYR